MVPHGEEGVGEQLVRNVAPPIVALIMCKMKKKDPRKGPKII